MVIDFKKINKAIEPISDFYETIAKNKKYYLPVFIFVLISYGFSLTNRSVSVDDLAQSFYYGDSAIKIRMYRWGQVLCNRLFSTIEYTPFINKFIGIIFYLITVFLLSTLLYILCNNDKYVWKYTIFSSLLISYPLINEICEFYESLTIPFNFAVVAFSLIYLHQNEKSSYMDHLFVGLLLSVVASGYESLMFAYITLVFIILFLDYCFYENCNGKTLDWFKEGIRYAIPLIIAFILRYVIGFLLMKFYNVSYIDFGNTSIQWTKDLWFAFTQLIFNGWYYGVRALSYFPISEFIIATIVFVFVVLLLIKKKKNNIIISLFLLISLFFLPILQGAHFGYRMAQTIQIFVAFVAYLMIELSQEKSNRIQITLIVLLLFVSLRQSIYLHELLALNNQRSDNEAYIARSIGYELYKNYDLEKTVVFVGDYQLGDFINSQITVDRDSYVGKLEFFLRDSFGYGDDIYDLNIVSGNVVSFLNWGKQAFSSQVMLRNYFSYYGFDIKTLESLSMKRLEEFESLAKEKEMKAYEILDVGDYILVCLGWKH